MRVLNRPRNKPIEPPPPPGWRLRTTALRLARLARVGTRAVLAPFGYLAFVAAVMWLSVAARLLGDEHELGYFAGRLNRTISRYPEVTRRGVQVAWLAWAVAFVVAISPVDPIKARWDEVALFALLLAVLWRRTFAARRAAS